MSCERDCLCDYCIDKSGRQAREAALAERDKRIAELEADNKRLRKYVEVMDAMMKIPDEPNPPKEEGK